MGSGPNSRKDGRMRLAQPDAVAEIEFLEWTGEDHLRHTKFIRLRNDKNPRQVVRET